MGPNHPRTLDAMNNLAWFLATAPEPESRDPARAVELAKQAVAKTKSANCSNTLGVAYYRAGDWRAAIAALEESMRQGQGGNGFDWLFLAMAQWQLGQRDQARHWYDRAAQWMEINRSQDVELRRFRDEAAALLGIVAPDVRKPK
jgi:Tfp pilus assembly protein PilF